MRDRCQCTDVPEGSSANLPCSMGPALCHSCGKGARYPWLRQMVLLRCGSCVRGAQEFLFSRLCSRGAGLQLDKGALCLTDTTCRSKRLLGQLRCGFAMPITRASVLSVPS